MTTIDRKYFKTTTAYERQKYLHPLAIGVMLHAVNFAPTIGVNDLIFTETVTTEAEDKLVGRQHDQHRRRVAVDVRVKNWSGEQIDAMEKELDTYFNSIAYVNGAGKKEVAFCHGEADNIHFHVAINAKFKLPEITDFEKIS